MTDPRTAALAAALKENTGHETPEEDAAAILAALRANGFDIHHDEDWYAHTMSDAAEIDRLRAELRVAHLDDTRDAELASLRDDLAHCERAWEDAGNELARLRKIEEAARAVVRSYGPYYEGDAAEVLRAALEAER